CRFIGCYKNKAYKWGYFPKVKKYEDIDTLVDGKTKNSFLFVGRFIDWKRPELAVKIAKKLKEDGYDFTLDMIGIGDREAKTKCLIRKSGLDARVRLLGSMSPEKVREHMEKAEIFLFTSNKQEGWGAVLNESMNSACAVVASGEIGSVPYLIEDGKTGFTFKSKKDLYKKVKYLLDNPEKRKAIGLNAYKTMAETWNAETAADRLLTLIQNLKEDKDTEYNSGPCSKD
ncbi:MAG: glycosyltransferase, partial [Clostridia bacterium]|nr:glycosyltransferase [Clostridia bacterium]